MSHEKYQHCIDACQECITECEHCSSACLKEDNVKMLVRCIELDRSCAYVCAFAANEMARGSEFAERVCQLCAEICEACGEECAKHKMEHCQRSAVVDRPGPNSRQVQVIAPLTSTRSQLGKADGIGKHAFTFRVDERALETRRIHG